MGAIQKILSYALLVFALVSIGFVFGKNSVKQKVQDVQNASQNDYVAVYYLHSTFRCETCNSIEKMTESLVTGRYSQELQKELVVWQVVDFQEQQHLAEQFEVAASCVVVAQVRDGQVKSYSRLDDVWTLIDNPSAFKEYVAQSIDNYLAEGRKIS